MDNVLTSKLITAAATVAPTDYAGQMGAMLTALGNDLLERLTALLPDQEAGQVYARPYQIAKRWGYTEGALRRFLYAAEQSGKVRAIRPKDINGAAGQTLYHLGDLERFFAAANK